MFDKILIANRGEIACRIIRTAKQMGIKTVAVYSEPDHNAQHVRMADEAFYIGPAPSSQSYLNIDRLLKAVSSTGAQAVHPGYGFLSENAKFAEALAHEGITFIGPSIAAIRNMGDKIKAKEFADKAKVSTVPGYPGEITSAKQAIKIAADIGFPVMIKAAAGGGGKGMRVVHSKSEVEQAFISATNEAKNSFSDGRIFIEKFITQPRHIEIQVLADQHGNVVCLGERECSIQRHHQKVIEEAPSSFIDAKTRKKMYDQVTALAKKVGYYSAGTVEFIVDKDKNFYFLEMNTRLQVEHCVTELITGIDIVEQMIRVANGEKLPFTQKDIELKGWAIESRIYAEDPSRGFLPSSGRINQYVEPKTGKYIRIDSGVYEGGEVSMFYDAMIAKLCSYGENRDDAIKKMRAALGEFVIQGISHNISFLEAVIGHPRFAAGDISTNFIAEEYPDGFGGADLNAETSRVFLATALHIYLRDAERNANISGQVPGRSRQLGNRWVVSIDNKNYPVYVRSMEKGYTIRLDNKVIKIRSLWSPGNGLFKGNINGRSVSVKIDHFPGGYYLTHAGSRAKVTVRSTRVAELSKFMPERTGGGSMGSLKAPISGMIVAVKVKEGAEIKSGQELLVLESMKMENIIYADHDSKVRAVYVKEGESIATGQVIMEFA